MEQEVETTNENYGSTANVNADDLDEETKEILRGDRIGDTMYSQSFVLSTLLKFSDLQWSDEVEEELCFLWDMAAEKDVCKFLFASKYPSFACEVIQKYGDNNRLIEIVIGILANLFCSDCGDEKYISSKEIETVLNVLNSDDPLILVQIIRFICSLAFDSLSIDFISEDLLNKLYFILNNSTNNELLLKTMETFCKLTVGFKINNKLLTGDIFKSTLTAYHTILNESEDEYAEEDTAISNEQNLAKKYLIEITCNICSYINEFENKKLFDEVIQHSNIFVTEIVKILNSYNTQDYLLPLTSEVAYQMSALNLIFAVLRVNYTRDLFLTICEIFYTLLEEEVNEPCLEIICYFIHKGSVQDIVNDLRKLPYVKIQKILNSVKRERKTYEYFSYMEHFNSVLCNFC